MTTDNTAPKQLTPWHPGQSGNPSGRPKGSRNRTTLAAEALLDGEAEQLTRKAIELAKGERPGGHPDLSRPDTAHMKRPHHNLRSSYNGDGERCRECGCCHCRS